MSKIVFFCIPAHGHTNPTLGVVRELVARGHEVTYYSYEMMREKIQETGAKFVPCDAYDPQVHLSKEDTRKIGKDLAFSTGLIVDLTLALDDAILQDMKTLQPDVIASDSMAFWGKLIARKLEIPFVSSTTTFAFNQHSAKVMKQSGPGLFSMLKCMPKVNKSLQRLREKGYPVKSVLDIVANDNDTKTIVYTSPLFQPCAETFSDNYAFVGPILRPAREPLEKNDQPTVYLSLGTADNDHPGFYQNCLKALSGQPYRVILSVGRETDIDKLGDIPANCQVAHTVDQIAVLQQADVFVTHCGMNSVSEALYFGVPLVLFPQTPEQQGVANRVLELKAGITLENTTPEAIRRAVQTALERQELKDGAAEIQASFHQCGGAKAAAEFIERAS
jgi:MGT family glycosyltransferase